MKCPFLILLLVFTVALFGKSHLTVTQLTTEYKSDPLGIDEMHPRLAWQLLSDQRGVGQSAYQIRVAASAAALEKSKGLVWDSGKVASDASTHVVYEGPALTTGARYYWQVRVWDQNGKASPWSAVAFWEMGLLEKSDWKASWIEAEPPADGGKSSPSPMLRKEFIVKSGVISARAWVTALGLYEMELNGKKVGDQVLTPGWTAYDKRVQYQTYDITPLLKSGANAVGVLLGDGWYSGSLGFSGQRGTYGKSPALLMQMRILYRDGSSDWVVTDGSWACSTGPILANDIYHGECYDSRLERKGWSTAGYPAEDWKPVRIKPAPAVALVAPQGPPIIKAAEIKVVRAFKTPQGESVVDMGQNMVGWVRMRVKGPAGTTVRLTFFEVLDRDGNVYLDNLRAAKQTDTFVLDGSGEQLYEPRFTFHGFRYVRVQNSPGDLTDINLTGVVVRSGYEPSGAFSCSEPMLNQLQHNIQWGQHGNFVDVPTDCPQRDERLGWTGDAQVFCRTACFNANVASFYTKWLKDLALDQKASGAVPHVIPNVLNKDDPKDNAGSAAWADAAVIVPWTVYLCYGDTRILQQQYPSMKAWVDYMARKAGDTYFWNTDFAFGDWLAFATDRSDYPGATTDKDLICQAYFARSTDLVQRTAVLLGKKEDAAYYADLLAKVKKVFMDEFVTPNGRVSSNTQTAYSLALAFELLPEALRPIAAKRLADDVNRFKHITTGFVGAPLVCPVLSDNGYFKEAFMLLNRKEYPSWLYPITKGATTIWERWDGIKADGSFQDAGMNSFNHYAYGAIGEWLYRFVAGVEIDPNQPGYKHILFQPHPGGGLTQAKAEVRSLYGPVACGWELKDKKMRLNLVVPPNTTATAILPNTQLDGVKEGVKKLGKVDGVIASEQKGSDVVLELGSGTYNLTFPCE
ncbi:MAG TPA: glycoside hydrolase family 78 protein [bacterium]|nr:glycoside hydrolase family 78 protein [bacterium]